MKVYNLVSMLGSMMNEEVEILENDNKVIVIIKKKQPTEKELNEWADEVLEEVK